MVYVTLCFCCLEHDENLTFARHEECTTKQVRQRQVFYNSRQSDSGYQLVNSGFLFKALYAFLQKGAFGASFDSSTV